MLDALEENHPEETEKLVQAVNNYAAKIKKPKIRNWLIENPSLLKIGWNKLILILGLPIFRGS